jgi:hypothetical protein
MRFLGLALLGATVWAAACGDSARPGGPASERLDAGTSGKDGSPHADAATAAGDAVPPEGDAGNTTYMDAPPAADAGATDAAALPPDAAPLLESGRACASPAACASGFCVDGVCCETACAGTCQGCVSVKTSLRDGMCGPARPGSDPDGDCERMPQESCGQDGECDGAGACRKYGADTLCSAESCVVGLYTPARQCDGKGQCANVTAVPCGAYPCDGNRCRMNCGSNEQCVTGNFCQAGQCVAKKATGTTCAAAGDCLSGYCVDGMCCEGPCGDRCLSCKRASTEQPDGKCAPVKTGTDPDGDCNEESGRSCGNDGYCDGKGACRKHGTDVTCADARCSNGEATSQGKCDGKGKCTAGRTTGCDGLACDGDRCRAMCMPGVGESAGCLTDRYCEASRRRCSTPKGAGVACPMGVPGECRSDLRCAAGTNLCCAATNILCNGKGGVCSDGTYCASGQCDLTDPTAGKCQ